MNDVKYPELPEQDAFIGMGDGMSIVVPPSEWKRFNAYKVFTADQMRSYADATCALRGAQIPDGWKLIPFKPTEDMCRAAVVFANGSAVYKNLPAAVLEIEEGIYGEVFEAMLAAAPKPNSYGCTCQSGKCPHASSCAVHNAPAYLPGPCDCGVISPPTPEGEAK